MSDLEAGLFLWAIVFLLDAVIMGHGRKLSAGGRMEPKFHFQGKKQEAKGVCGVHANTWLDGEHDVCITVFDARKTGNAIFMPMEPEHAIAFGEEIVRLGKKGLEQKGKEKRESTDAPRSAEDFLKLLKGELE